ncbi:hypothetical protein BGZ65_002431, partial [Modicella reniformis]
MSPRTIQHFANKGEIDIIKQAASRATISTFEQHVCLAIFPEYLRVLRRHSVRYLARRLVQDRQKLQKPYDLDEPLPKNLQKQDKLLEILQYLNNPSENDALLVLAHVLVTLDARSTWPLCKGIEISNIEFKRPSIGMMDINVQCRKNIRLGRCLQEQHREYGVQEPSVIMGDVADIFYQLAKMGE